MKQLPPVVNDTRLTRLINVTGASEKISNPLWDVRDYLQASPVTTLSFFADKQAGVDRTNQKIGGTIPQGHFQEVLGLIVKADAQVTAAMAATNAINDIRLLGRNGVLTLNISNKQYGTWPLWMLFGGSGVWTDGATDGLAVANNLVTGNTGVPDPRSYYELSEPVIIPPQQPFNVTVRWPANQTITADVRLTVVLEGSEYRPIT